MKLLLFRNAVAKEHNTFEVTKSYIYVLGHVNVKDTLSEGKLFWNMTVFICERSTYNMCSICVQKNWKYIERTQIAH